MKIPAEIPRKFSSFARCNVTFHPKEEKKPDSESAGRLKAARAVRKEKEPVEIPTTVQGNNVFGILLSDKLSRSSF